MVGEEVHPRPGYSYLFRDVSSLESDRVPSATWAGQNFADHVQFEVKGKP